MVYIPWLLNKVVHYWLVIVAFENLLTSCLMMVYAHMVHSKYIEEIEYITFNCGWLKTNSMRIKTETLLLYRKRNFAFESLVCCLVTAQSIFKPLWQVQFKNNLLWGWWKPGGKLQKGNKTHSPSSNICRVAFKSDLYSIHSIRFCYLNKIRNWPSCLTLENLRSSASKWNT
jgi:hypothetical protein